MCEKVSSLSFSSASNLLLKDGLVQIVFQGSTIKKISTQRVKCPRSAVKTPDEYCYLSLADSYFWHELSYHEVLCFVCLLCLI